jgi:hypothetical protein
VAEAIASERLARAETGERALRAAEARAEAAAAISAERLARAEAAEHALLAAEAALAGHPSSLPADIPRVAAAPAEPDPPKRPASLLERWRRYTDTLN